VATNRLPISEVGESAAIELNGKSWRWYRGGGGFEVWTRLVWGKRGAGLKTIAGSDLWIVSLTL
jgi:hypothetical protein